MQIIVAVDQHWGIGKNNQLLFSIPKDLQFFKETTEGKVVVMGRKTLQSLPHSRPLKNRMNIVLSKSAVVHSDLNLQTQNSNIQKIDNLLFVKDHATLFQSLQQYNTDDVLIIGGAMVYKDLLPYCSKAWVTKVFADGQATHFFENLDELQDWEMIETKPIQEDNGYTFQICRYKNNKIKNL